LEIYVIVFLGSLLIIQNLYWMKVCFELNNRLMSRNYYDYNQAVALKSPSVQTNQVEEIDFDAERQARELNSIMGVV